MDDNAKDMEYELADIITERPHEFTVGRKQHRLYPVTLAKIYMLRRYIEGLSINPEHLRVSPYLEALRLVEEHAELCRDIIAIHATPNTYRDLYCRQNMVMRRNALSGIRKEDMATLMMIVLTADKTELLMDGLGINKEHERMRKALERKDKNDGNITYGGVTVFGSFIAPLKEMGYTDNEILFEKGYTFLRLMLADKVTTVYLTDEERENMSIEDGGTLIDGNNPESFEHLKEFVKGHGLTIND